MVARGGLVLVVDDDAGIRDVVREILELEGYPVEMAQDGDRALAALGRELPAVVLLDMRMPVLDGWGFVREARARGLRVPIVAMTAARDAAAWCAEIEADACLDKPFDMESLLEAVRGLIGAPPG